MPGNMHLGEELSKFASQLYETKYPMPEIELIGLATDPDSLEGAEEVVWDIYDSRGRARFASGTETTVPLVQEAKTRSRLPQQYIELGYGWTLAEMRAYQANGRAPNLDQRRASAARKGHADLQNSLALLGDGSAVATSGETVGHKGLYKHPDAQIIPMANAGLWTAKTAEQILQDMTRLMNSVNTNTKGLERASTLIIPASRYDVADEKDLANFQGQSAIDRFRVKFPGIEIIKSQELLDTAGASNAARMVAVDRSQVLRILAQPFAVLEPQSLGYTMVFPCYSMAGGIKTAAPKAIAYMDGI